MDAKFTDVFDADLRRRLDRLLPDFDGQPPGRKREAGIGYFVILSMVGVDQVPDLDYYRPKVLQENILKAGTIPAD